MATSGSTTGKLTIGPIVRLQPGDFGQLEALLTQNGLPADDCAVHADIFHGMFHGELLVAAGGLEPVENHGLLRSLVVRAEYRGHGLARALTEFLVELASSQGRASVYLLTETAADYFTKLGFESATRDRAPAGIAATLQFTSLCPDSASCLMMPLPGAPGPARK